MKSKEEKVKRQREECEGSLALVTFTFFLFPFTGGVDA
jgi:hypothetical protein